MANFKVRKHVRLSADKARNAPLLLRRPLQITFFEDMADAKEVRPGRVIMGHQVRRVVLHAYLHRAGTLASGCLLRGVI